MFKLESKPKQDFKFEFEGEVYSIPSRSSLPMKRFREIRKAIQESDSPEETGFDEIMKIFDEHIPEVMERIDMAQAMELFRAYSNGGDEASLGKS